MKLTLATILAFCFTEVSAEVLSLTSANFQSETAGKTVFIKYFAPWCGHCKSLAPTWEELAEKYKGHEFALVAEVDCTTQEAEDLCEAAGVEGYPTIKWGDPDGLEDYEGGRDLDELTAHAETYCTKPVCSVAKLEYCDDATKKVITGLQAKSADDLKAIEMKVIDGQKAARSKMEEGMEKLNAMYEEMTEEYEAAMAKIEEDHNHRLVAQVLNQKEPGRAVPSADSDSDDRDEL